MSVPPPYPASGPQSNQNAGPPPKNKLSGCALAAIILAVCGVGGIAVIAILAAIALPQYNDYITRTKIAGAELAASEVKVFISSYRDATGVCPDASALAAQAPTSLPITTSGGPEGRAVVVWAAAADNMCAFDLRFEGVGPAADGKTIQFNLGKDGEWDCRGGDLPAHMRLQKCR
jgi:type IV pilus assembly protein PilA